MTPEIESFLRAVSYFIERYRHPEQRREVCRLVGEQLAEYLRDEKERENETSN